MTWPHLIFFRISPFACHTVKKNFNVQNWFHCLSFKMNKSLPFLIFHMGLNGYYDSQKSGSFSFTTLIFKYSTKFYWFYLNSSLINSIQRIPISVLVQASAITGRNCYNIVQNSSLYSPGIWSIADIATTSNIPNNQIWSCHQG